MIIRNYNSFLTRCTRIFLMPEGAAGGGGGGEGGGAAVAEPPGGDAPPVDPDLANFEAPDISEALKVIGGGEPEPKPPGAPPKKEEKPPGTPPAKPPTEPPAAQLRKEYDAIKAQLATAEEKLKVGDPRIKELEAKLAEKDAEITSSKGQLSEYEKKLALANPAVTKPLRDLQEARDSRSGKFFTRVADIDAPTVSKLVEDYWKLPFGKEGYKEARAAFDKKVNETLGGSDDREHRHLNQTLDFIESESDFWREYGAKEKEVQGKALQMAREAAASDFNGRREFVRTKIKEVQMVPEDLSKSNPFHPRVVLNAFLSAIGEEKAGEFKKGLDDFVELGLAGVAPRSDADYANMTPAQIREAQDGDAARHEKAREYIVDAAYNGALAYRVLPSLYKDWLRLKEKVKDDVDPPDPTRQGGSGGAPSDADSLKDFAAPNLDAVDFHG